MDYHTATPNFPRLISHHCKQFFTGRARRSACLGLQKSEELVGVTSSRGMDDLHPSKNQKKETDADAVHVREKVGFKL